MDQSNAEREPSELDYAAWIFFWAQLAVLAVVAVFGAFFASNNASPDAYGSGLGLSLAALALGFLRVKSRFDGRSAGASLLPVADMPSLVAVIVIFTALALAGLFVAAGAGHGVLHDSGLALFVVSALAIFLGIKHFFDAIERPH